MRKTRTLRVKSIAQELGCSPETVRRWWREGKLPGAFKIGGDTSPIKMTEGSLGKLKRKRCR